MNGTISICGLDCSECEWKDNCRGCSEIGEKCVIALCCKSKGKERCGGFFAADGSCGMERQLIKEFNSLALSLLQATAIRNSFKFFGFLTNNNWFLQISKYE